MNVNKQDFQTMGADIALALAQEFGESMTYSNRGGVAVTVYGFPESETKELLDAVGGNSKLDQEDTTATFQIPYQTGFPPATGVSVTDVIAWDGRNWDVVTPKVDSAKAMWVLQCVRQKMRRIGA